MVFERQKKGVVCVRHDDGFAMLLLLVAIAILLILYFLQTDALFEPVSPARKKATTYRPWLEEYRIVPGDKPIKPPRPPKPAISEPLTLVARVRLDENDRGTAALEFAISGEVRGTWYCEYSHEDRDYRFDASFAGNIDVSKTYTEGDITDESRLYFITKGKYRQTAYNAVTGAMTSEEGIIYVDGWLRTDYSATGLITITTDKAWSASYELQTE